jgi:hypothetical protein
LDGLVPTKAGAVSVRVVCVSLVALELVLAAVVLVVVALDELLVALERELRLLDVEVVELAEEVAAVVVAGTVRVTVTVGEAAEPHAASVTVPATSARPSRVVMLSVFIAVGRFLFAIAAANGYRAPRRERE